MTVSTHVLDTAAGGPVEGMPVRLERMIVGLAGDARGWRSVTSTATDVDGRVRDLPVDGVGAWRLVFDTESRSAFFPEVVVTFVVSDPAAHHHVPLLLSPFGFSTYRGS
ncbi:hydroxyisourate hydrolase [Frankia sp. Cppng1_Ct_nod]|uniref:hydroxyisourate hydrolase n=1 Tax=Frankia sp. Cppng1_Ct_nod TaxID=2897162 RepID=UPI0010410C2F|nr:hydroxyisourate hydrolase [Frankia sp. Cppng1_Ct_nod]